jgi:hypothetical protein
MKKEKNKFTMKRDRLLLNNKKNWINQNKTLNNIFKNNRFLFFRFGHWLRILLLSSQRIEKILTTIWILH